MSDQIQKLKASIENRVKKIADVDARTKRYDDHVSQIQKNRERFLQHRERWVEQNARDMAKLTELGDETYAPVPADPTPAVATEPPAE